MVTTPDVQFEEVSGRDGHLGLITLNRPQVLNALNHSILNAMEQQLTVWEEANHIKAVVIRAAEGRAFCAGGDIRAAYERKMAKDPLLGQFFQDEYQLNQHIHHYLKPYIALMDGITMGGGAGISLHGSHRVATERLLFAMPETGIGFYPDVGATYFLSRLSHKFGFYLGLTGARIQLSDCVALGLIDQPVEPTAFPDIIYQLADSDFGNDPNAAVTDVLKQFTIPLTGSPLLQHQEEVANCFGKKSMKDILSALEKGSSWCQTVAAELMKKSPTSLKVTLRALQEAGDLEFDDCMQMEHRLTMHFLEGHDFFEGIRAAVIDKDQTPHWQPAMLEELTAAEIKKYFEQKN